MLEEGLPTAVRSFIETYIVSVEQLEILLMLARQPGTAHTVQSVYNQILSAKPSVEAWLNRFVDLRIVEKSREDPPSYQFKPIDLEQASSISQLAQAYQSMPVRTIEAIYNRQRIGAHGADPAQGFADAFKLRKP